jgi:peptidoglycan/xylan/chitin deacetylase (PgdA/CDA1 family)
MYHALEDAGYPAGAGCPGEELYVIRAERFREQMSYLKREGFTTLLLEEVLALDHWPERSVLLTFDDGHRSNFTLALPILREFGFRADFFITTGWLGTPNFLLPSEVRALAEAGMGLGTHGVHHRFFDDLSEAELEDELGRCRRELAEVLGRPVVTCSAPGGRVCRSLAKIARRTGYAAVATSRPTQLRRGGGAFAVPRFAVTRDTDLGSFARIVSGDRRYLRALTLRAFLLAAGKALLGNRRYVMMREFALRRIKGGTTA